MSEGLAAVGAADGHSDTVNLVLSELVTNALEYGAPPFMVTVSVTHDATRIAVEDAGAQFPSRRAPMPPDGGGFGLNLVDAASREWGVTARHGNGKVVWAEIPIAFSFASVLAVDA